MLNKKIITFLYIYSIVLCSSSLAETGFYIRDFTFSEIPFYQDNSSKNKVKTLKKEELTQLLPLKILLIGEKKRFYKVEIQNHEVWVRSRHVISDNIKASCLKLASNSDTHIAGSRALSGSECKNN